MGNLFNRCRRCFLYLVLLIPLVGYAETIPLPNISQPAKIYWRTDSVEFNPDVSGPLGQSPEAFCQQIYTAKGYTYSSFAMGSGSLGLCSGTAGGWNRQVSIQRRYKCSETSTDSSTTPTTCTISACPDATWTQEGNSCTRPDCPAGFDRGADGQCLKDCTGKRGMSTVNNGYEFVGAVSNWSVGGCRVRCEQRVLASGGGMGYSCKFTGASASPDNPEAEALPPDPKELPPEEPNDCLAKGQGFIKSSTGKITCVPSSEAPAGNKPDKVESDKSKEIGKPGDEGYLKEEETNSSDSDGNTTTTKKETKNGTPDGNGGVTCPSGYVKNADNTCTKTTTEKQTTKGFCEENPNATVCKEAEKSVFGGGCESGFTCTGDAAQCAAARATWETRCMYREDATTPLHDAANPGGTPSQIDAAEKALNRDGSRNFDVGSEFAAKNNAYVGFSSTCPIADQTFTILRATVVVPASIVCSIGAFIKLLIHIVAYMAVLRLFAFKLV